jgi:hypothetical protein
MLTAAPFFRVVGAMPMPTYTDAAWAADIGKNTHAADSARHSANRVDAIDVDFFCAAAKALRSCMENIPQ